MEFMTGKKEKEVLDLAAVFADGMDGREVKVNGAIIVSATWAISHL